MKMRYALVLAGVLLACSLPAQELVQTENLELAVPEGWHVYGSGNRTLPDTLQEAFGPFEDLPGSAMELIATDRPFEQLSGDEQTGSGFLAVTTQRLSPDEVESMPRNWREQIAETIADAAEESVVARKSIAAADGTEFLSITIVDDEGTSGTFSIGTVSRLLVMVVAGAGKTRIEGDDAGQNEDGDDAVARTEALTAATIRSLGMRSVDSEEAPFFSLLRFFPDRSMVALVLADLQAAARAAGEALGTVRPRASAGSQNRASAGNQPTEDPNSFPSTESLLEYERALARIGVPDGPLTSGYDTIGARFGWESTREMRARAAQELRRNAGYGLHHVERFALDRIEVLGVVELDRDAESIRRRLLESEVPPELRAAEFLDRPVLDYREIDPDSWELPAVGRVGAQALAFRGPRILSAPYPEGVVQMAYAASGGVPSLAGGDSLRALIRLSDTENLYALALSTVDRGGIDTIPGLQSRVAPEASEGLSALTPLRPFSAQATGIGYREGEFFVTVYLMHDSEEEAAANVSILRGKLEAESSFVVHSGVAWRELFRLGQAEIRSDGALLYAVLPLRDALERMWSEAAEYPLWQAMLHVEPLLFHR